MIQPLPYPGPTRIGAPAGEGRELPVSHVMWHVTVTAGGDPIDAELVHQGLELLAIRHPFLLSGRFACDRAEVSYWDEGDNVEQVFAAALGLWAQHRAPASLPDWKLLGVEVIDQETFRRRGRAGELDPRLAGAPNLTPYP